MESSFDACSEPRVQRVDFKALRRLGALEVDMAYYGGPGRTPPPRLLSAFSRASCITSSLWLETGRY